MELDVNPKINLGSEHSPLGIAFRNSNSSIAEYLIQKGAYVVEID